MRCLHSQRNFPVDQLALMGAALPFNASCHRYMTCDPYYLHVYTCPAERHISVDPYELKMSIKNRLELADREKFDDLTKLMEGVANFDFYDLKQRLVSAFVLRCVCACHCQRAVSQSCAVHGRRNPGYSCGTWS
jgi:hypothetical protein